MRRVARDFGAVFGTVAFFAAALAGCNFLVGVGDYSVGDAESPPDGAGSEETGSNADAGAEDAVEVDAHDAGRDRAAAEAEAEAAGDAPVDRASEGDVAEVDAKVEDRSARPPDAEAGAELPDAEVEAGVPDAEAGAPTTCGLSLPTAQASFQQLVATCVLSVSCDPLLFPVTLSSCITRNELQSTGTFACLSTISDCTGFYNCQGGRFATLTECPGFDSFCDTTNNVAVDCSEAVVFPGQALNCTKSGGTCATFTDDSGFSRADCVVVPSCTVPDGGAPECTANNKDFSCIDGVGYGTDCTAVSATCSSAGAAGTACYPDGTACSTPGVSSCSGNTLVSCDVTSQGFNFDCTRAGGTCVQGGAAGTAGCVSPGCTLASRCTESCDGDHTLSVCVGGAPFAIDCTQYGFTSCGPFPADPSSPNVYCLP